MELWYFLVIAFLVILLFILSIQYTGAMLYGAIIVFSAIGFLLSLSSAPYTLEGENITYEYESANSTKIVGENVVEIKNEYTNLQFIFSLFFIASLLSAIILWIKEPTEDED